MQFRLVTQTPANPILLQQGVDLGLIGLEVLCFVERSVFFLLLKKFANEFDEVIELRPFAVL